MELQSIGGVSTSSWFEMTSWQMKSNNVLKKNQISFLYWLLSESWACACIARSIGRLVFNWSKHVKTILNKPWNKPHKIDFLTHYPQKINKHQTMKYSTKFFPVSNVLWGRICSSTQATQKSAWTGKGGWQCKDCREKGFFDAYGHMMHMVSFNHQAPSRCVRKLDRHAKWIKRHRKWAREHKAGLKCFHMFSL